MALRVSVRRLREAPGFALSVLLTVALVVLVNASACAAWWALLYKRLPIAHAERWVDLRIDLRDIDFQVGLSPSMFAAVRDNTQSFDAVVGAPEIGHGKLDEQARPWRVQRISPDFTHMLGVSPARGQAFASGAGAAFQLLLSDRTWRDRFSADPMVLGRRLRIADTEFQIIGVMPPGFAWPDADVQAWTPWQLSPGEREQDAMGGFGQFHVAARLAPGVGIAQAEDSLAQILSASGNKFLSSNPERVRAQVRYWRDRFTANHLPMLLLLQCAAALLLLVAAANIIGLTLDRLHSHRRGYAIRHAVGARVTDLFKLIVADLLLPTSLGAALGLALTPRVIDALASRGLLPTALPLTVGGDLPTLLMALLSAALVIALAVVSAWLSLRGFVAAGSLSDRASVPGLGRSQAIALVMQIALTTVLAGACGLLLRSAVKLADENRGFDPRGVLLTQIEFAADRPGQAVAVSLQRVQDAIAALPGVETQSSASMPPFGGAEFLMSVALPGSDTTFEVRAPAVGVDYFQALRMPFIAGRDFTADERRNGNAVIVDEHFWRQHLHAAAVPGASLRRMQEGEAPQELRVVGVVPAVKQKALDEPAGQSFIYSPLLAPASADFLITRTAADVLTLADQVRRVLAVQAPDAQLMANLSLSGAIARTWQTRRALLEAVSLFALATLLLAALGLYAVLNAAVSRRRAEFGVRMALGGAPGSIRRLILRQAGSLIGIGLALGVLCGLFLASLMAQRLHQLAPSDPLTWISTALAVSSVGFLACWLPALRATRVAPRIALDEAPQTWI